MKPPVELMCASLCLREAYVDETTGGAETTSRCPDVNQAGRLRRAAAALLSVNRIPTGLAPHSLTHSTGRSVRSHGTGVFFSPPLPSLTRLGGSCGPRLRSRKQLDRAYCNGRPAQEGPFGRKEFCRSRKAGWFCHFISMFISFFLYLSPQIRLGWLVGAPTNKRFHRHFLDGALAATRLCELR